MKFIILVMIGILIYLILQRTLNHIRKSDIISNTTAGLFEGTIMLALSMSMIAYTVDFVNTIINVKDDIIISSLKFIIVLIANILYWSLPPLSSSIKRL